MKQIKTEDAVGCVLCQDITKIVKGEFKGAAFRKGHVVREEDVEELLNIGKRHLYVWEDGDNLVHENDAAQFIYDACGMGHVKPTEIKRARLKR